MFMCKESVSQSFKQSVSKGIGNYISQSINQSARLSIGADMSMCCVHVWKWWSYRCVHVLLSAHATNGSDDHSFTSAVTMHVPPVFEL